VTQDTGFSSEGVKNGAAFYGPRRRDIAPAGELAGLPGRDSPKLFLSFTPDDGPKLHAMLPKIAA
jgi:hypothetical protein